MTSKKELKRRIKTLEVEVAQLRAMRPGGMIMVVPETPVAPNTPYPFTYPKITCGPVRVSPSGRNQAAAVHAEAMLTGAQARALQLMRQP